MSCLFSVLICSLHRRHQMLERLQKCLAPQIPLDGSVEVLVDRDNGEVSIGHKRNRLLEKAQGKFIAFVDDDDLVSCDYVYKILEIINNHPQVQVIGMSLIMTTNDTDPEKSFHSIQYRSWWDCPDEETGRKKYFRNPNHLNPVLRELALKIKFPKSNHGEDHDYSSRLLPLLHCEFVIKDPIYFYLNRWPKHC
jgi:glycosyltransferase involved in cell wall biosynthesis